MNDVLGMIRKMGLVPVVVMEDVDLAVPTARALMNSGLDAVEITMRTEQGISAIKRVKQAYHPSVLVGAGTVLSIEKAEEAKNAGAEFIVAPGLNLELVQ